MDLAQGQDAIHDSDAWDLTGTSSSDQKFENEPELLFTSSNVTFDQHYIAQESYRNIYMATLKVLLANRVEIPQGIKVRVVAVAWARKDHDLAQTLLGDPANFTLAELMKALTLLEAGRKIREKERQLRQFQVLFQDNIRINHKKISKIKSDIDNLRANKTKLGSVSGALSRHIRRWVRSLTGDQLEFYALHYPKEPWRKLADICHLHPKKDFPSKHWFLPYCFGEPAPSDSLASKCTGLSGENVNEIVKGADIPYTHIKQYKDSLSEESKERIASYEEKVDTLLWYYEDLHTTKVDEVICCRINEGEKVTLPTGKLMEKLFNMHIFRMYSKRYKFKGGSTSDALFELLTLLTEERLKSMEVPLEGPVAVLGDMSPSMGIAIKTSTIIAGLLAAITDAKLSFFCGEDYVPDKVPTTVSEVIEMARSMDTGSGTAPAASLWPYYERKEVIKTFVVVTDEDENQQSPTGGYYFLPLFKKYRDEVYADTKLVFISFLYSQHNRGQMCHQLREEGIQPMQFKFNSQRPDLTKLDSIFGLLSVKTGEFKEEVDRIARELTDAHIKTGTQKDAGNSLAGAQDGTDTHTDAQKRINCHPDALSETESQTDTQNQTKSPADAQNDIDTCTDAQKDIDTNTDVQNRD